jgi:Amt family ammonium transporter
VWPLHGLSGSWGGIATGIFGQKFLGGMGGVSIISQIAGAASGALFSVCVGLLVYGALKKTVGIRLDEKQERQGSDLAIHNIGAYPEQDMLGL